MRRVHTVNELSTARRVVGFRRRQRLRGIVRAVVGVWQAVGYDCVCRCVGYDFRGVVSLYGYVKFVCALQLGHFSRAAAVWAGDPGGLDLTAFERKLGNRHTHSAYSLAVAAL